MTSHSVLTMKSPTMTPFGKQPSTVQWLLAAATLASIVVFPKGSARADIILDDFTDSAMAQGPLVDDDDFVETHDVGNLHARREIRVAGGGTDVVGVFDINVTSPGQMTVKVDEIVPTITGLPLTAVQFNYDFQVSDVTQGGQNDAILFDFVERVGDIQPTFLRAWVFDNTSLRESFIIELFPLVQNRMPHTLAARFDQFTNRGVANQGCQPRQP